MDNMLMMVDICFCTARSRPLTVNWYRVLLGSKQSFGPRALYLRQSVVFKEERREDKIFRTCEWTEEQCLSGILTHVA